MGLFSAIRAALRTLASRGEDDTPTWDDYVNQAVRLARREYPTTPAERRFADAVENWMKERTG